MSFYDDLSNSQNVILEIEIKGLKHKITDLEAVISVGKERNKQLTEDLKRVEAELTKEKK